MFSPGERFEKLKNKKEKRMEKVKVRVKVKVKFTLEQATKAQRWSKVTALLFP